MKYQIDQSGKVEQTNINTIIALANDKDFSILLKKQDKRILEKIFRRINKAKIFPYVIFSVLLAIIFKSTQINHKVIIDKEYLGHENFIRERVILYLRYLKVKNIPSIEFSQIGKTAKAHQLAFEVSHNKKKVNKVVKLGEVLKIIFAKKNDRVSAS